MADGLDAIQKLRDGGFSEEEVSKYQADQTGKLQAGGFSPEEVKSYWGNPTPQIPATVDQLHAHMEDAHAKATGGETPAKPADTFMDMLEAGYQSSFTGLVARGKLPDTVPPEHASMLGDIAYGTAQMISDAPALIAGAIGGSAVAGPIGGGAGAFGLPAYLRTGLMDYYKEGGTDTRPYLTKLTDAFLGKHALLEGAKATAVGALSTATLGPVGGALAKTALPEVAQAAVSLQTMAATATTVNAALEGRMPKAHEFLENGLMAAAGHGVIEGAKAGIPEAGAKISEYMKGMYEKSGELPHETAARMANDPIARSDAMTYDPKFENTVNPPSGENPMPEKPLFHGTKSEIPGGEFRAEFMDKNALYGPGIYTTDNPEIASSYAETKTRLTSGELATRLEQHFTPGKEIITNRGYAKVVSFNNAGSDWSVVAQKVASNGDPIGAPFETKPPLLGPEEFDTLTKPSDKSGPNVLPLKVDVKTPFQVDKQFSLKELQPLVDADPTLENSLKYLTKDGAESIYGFQVYKEIADKMTWRTPEKELDKGRALTNDLLQKAGFDGIKHIGGRGKNEHNVTIAFKPEQVKSFFSDEAGTVGKPVEETHAVGKTDAETRILGTIGERPAKGYDSDDFLNQYVNPLHYAQEAVRNATKEATGKAAGKYENSGEYMRLAWGAPAKAERIVQRDLMPLWKAIPKEDRASAMAYLKAKQEADIIGQGLKSALDPKDVKEVLEAGDKNPLFLKTSRAITQYFNTSADQMVKDGLKSQVAVDAMKQKWPNYIPSDRIMGDDFVMPQAGKSFRVYDPVKALEGSNKETTNAFQAAVRVAQTRTSLGMKTQALQRYAEQSDSLPEEYQYFKKVSNEGSVKDNQIQYYEDGQLIRREAKDPRVVNSLVNMSPPEIGLGYKIGQKISSVFRLGIVASPDFWLQQPLRNEIAGQIVNTKGAFLTDMVKGMKPLLSRDPNFDRWVDAGGASHALFAFEQDIFNPDYFSLNEQKTLPANLWNQIKKPIHFLQAAGDVMGNAKSLGQFIRHTNAGMSETEAALRSRDATMDHMIIGTQMRGINAAGAFTAPFVNHLRQFTDMVKENPAHVATVGATLVTVPTVYLWWVNRNQDWYKDTDQLTKDRNWLIRTGGTDENPNIVKIKRPYVAGEIFGALPERMLNAYADHNPDAWDHIGRSLVDSVIPWKEAIPVWMRGPAEIMSNYNITNEAPLVSQNMEKNALPQYRMTPYTSDTAKILAKNTPEFLPDRFRTPIAMDHLVNAWSGIMGQYATQVIDQSLYATGVSERPVKPTPTLADLPFVKSFFLRYPSANMAPIQKFYDMADKAGQTVGTYRSLLQQGKDDEADKLAENNPELKKMARPLKAMGNLNKAIRGIQSDNSYTPDDKRQLIDNYMQQILAVAKDSVEAMRQ